MRISGRRVIQKGQAELFERLLDPTVLKQCLPGCEELRQSPDGSYDARLEVGLGPIRGTFQGRVFLLELDPPRGYTLEVRGDGKPGSLRGTVRVGLRAVSESATEVDYEADVSVGGLLASVGSRLIPGASRTFSEQFFNSLERALEDGRPG
jgi:uncharacterized protein